MFCIRSLNCFWFSFLLQKIEQGLSHLLVLELYYNVYVPSDNKAAKEENLSGKKLNASQILFAYDFSQDVVDKFIALYCFNALCRRLLAGCTQ